MSRRATRRRRRTIVIALLGLIVILGRGSPAQTPPLPDRIKAISADPETGAIYLLSPEHELWGLEPGAAVEFRLRALISHLEEDRPRAPSGAGREGPLRLEEFGLPATIEGRLAFCPVRLAGALWIAGVSSRPLSGGSVWRITTVLAAADAQRPADPFRGVSRISRFGRLMDVAFDPARERLLLTDPDREGIYEIKLSDDGLGELVLAISDKLLRTVTNLAILSDRLFVAERERRAVVAVDLLTQEAAILVEDLPSLDFLAVHPRGKRLIVGRPPGDGLRQIELADSSVTTIDLGEVKTGTVVSLAVDARDHLWIAGQNGTVLFEFGPGAAPRLERRWEWRRR